MKIIKRDGRVVEYNREKIETAIKKANLEVRQNERANENDIQNIVQYIEESNRRRMLVEEVQDIIEQKLMEIGKYELAKKYIVYRYLRALVRRQNTTDESILGMIRNENNNQNINQNENTMKAAMQRDLIAGEVSKDLTRRLLLPEKIVKAEQEGTIIFHDAEYFIQPIINSSLINIEDMFENGTVINGKTIETPKSFSVACTVLTQIIASVANNQYGEQYIDLMCMGKYLRKSYEKLKNDIIKKYTGKISEDLIEDIVKDRLNKELREGVQTIEYQLNTIVSVNGREPFAILLMHLEKNDQYIKENAMIFEEIINQRYEGLEDEEKNNITPKFPKLIYILNNINDLTGGEYDYLTKLATKCSEKRNSLYCMNVSQINEQEIKQDKFPLNLQQALKVIKNENGDYAFVRMFNQGVVSIDLLQIANNSNKENEKFLQKLVEVLELCKEALMCRHYALLGTKAEVSPILWQFGGIARLKKGENINKLLTSQNSTITLGYIGLKETVKLMTGKECENKRENEFAKKLLKLLKETTNRWKKENNICDIIIQEGGKNNAKI